MVGIQTPPQEKPASITQRVTLYGISWQTYTRILVRLETSVPLVSPTHKGYWKSLCHLIAMRRIKNCWNG